MIETIENKLKEKQFDHLQKLGNGGFGVVFAAKKNNYRCAIKCIEITTDGKKDESKVQKVTKEFDN